MDVTIEDGVDGGVIEDATMSGDAPDNNFGIYIYNEIRDTTAANFIIYVDLSAYSDITITSAKYIFEVVFAASTGTSVTVNPSLRAWGEGNKVNQPASTGEVTANSARHNEQAWTSLGGFGADTDYDSSISDGFTCPTSTGSFDVDLSVESVQSKIDTPSTNYGDIFRPARASIGGLCRFVSSEHTTAAKPQLYFEFTEGGGYNPFFFGAGHY